MRETLNLSQVEYLRKIEELNQSLINYWDNDQRVKALKIAIQVCLTVLFVRMYHSWNWVPLFPAIAGVDGTGFHFSQHIAGVDGTGFHFSQHIAGWMELGSTFPSTLLGGWNWVPLFPAHCWVDGTGFHFSQGEWNWVPPFPAHCWVDGTGFHFSGWMELGCIAGSSFSCMNVSTVLQAAD